jgi:hypothetical protein
MREDGRRDFGEVHIAAAAEAEHAVGTKASRLVEHRVDEIERRLRLAAVGDVDGDARNKSS